MKPVHSLCLILTAVLLFSTPAYAKRAPDWLGGSSKKYPSPQYFIGVGTATVGRGAEKQVMSWAAERARAELAKIIKTEVSVTSRQERDVKSDEKSRVPRSASSQSDTIVETSKQVLDGVEVKEYFTDKRSKTVYALAVLDRVKTGHLIEDRIKRLMGDVSSEMETGRGYQDAGKYIQAIKNYNKALSLVGLLNEQKEILSVVAPAGRGSDAGNYDGEIRRILSELKKHVQFSVAVTGPADGVKLYLAKGLARAGYFVVESAPYRLAGTTDLTPSGEINMGENLDLQIYNATLDIEVQDAKSGDVLGAMNFSANANEKTAEMASKSAVRALGRTVEENLGKRLMEVF